MTKQRNSVTDSKTTLDRGSSSLLTVSFVYRLCYQEKKRLSALGQKDSQKLQGMRAAALAMLSQNLNRATQSVMTAHELNELLKVKRKRAMRHRLNGMRAKKPETAKRHLDICKDLLQECELILEQLNQIEKDANRWGVDAPLIMSSTKPS